MKISGKRRKSHITLVIIECFIAVGLAVGVSIIFLKNGDLLAKIHEPFNVPTVQVPKVTEATSRILFTGTTFWGRNTRNAAVASGLNEDYPFVNFDGFGRENYQAWIGNLECPITEKEHTKAEEDDIFAFNCLPSYLPNVSKYWSTFSLGTNHADNWGDEGIEITKENLKNSGIQYFGNYHYDNATENCNIITVPVIAKLDNGSEYEFNMPLGFCSAHGVFGIPTEDALLNMKKYAEAIPTIVMPHMGVEYQNSADQLRTNLYHKMIDYGADMVLADHPHHVQNAEAYNGHLIAYSMGNFMFDQLFDETVYSAAIDITANFSADTDFDAWDEISSICAEKDGDCLDDIISSGLPRLDITWTNYDFVATTNAGNRQTRVGDANDRVFVERRLNWQSVVNNLK